MNSAKRKLEYDDCEDSRTKRLKDAEVEEIETSTVNDKTAGVGTNMTDFSDALLTNVFEHLNQKDLLNVAITSRRFASAAKGAFAEKYGQLFFEIHSDNNVQENVQFLEYFGGTITKLCIEFHETTSKNLLTAITEHCGQNILEFVFDYGYHWKWTKVMDKDFRVFLNGFGNRFPNLNHLKIRYARKPKANHINHWADVIKKFPALSCLTIENCPKFRIDDFFHLNRQMTRVILKNSTDWRIKQDVIASMDEKLPELKHLNIQFCNTAKQLYPFGQKYFQNLKTLMVRSHNKSYANVLKFLSISGDELEEFGLNVTGGTLEDPAIKMLSNYKKLKKLELGNAMTDIQLNEVATHLPQIEMLGIFFGNATQQGILKLVKECKQLTKFVIYPWGNVYDEDIERICNPIKKKLDSEWNVGDDGDGTILIVKNGSKW